MKRRLSAVEARKHLGEILDGVFYRGDEVVIERAGKPLAVVLPVFHYENLERDRRDVLEMIEEMQRRNHDVPGEILRQEVDEAVSEVRRERRERDTKDRDKTA